MSDSLLQGVDSKSICMQIFSASPILSTFSRGVVVTNITVGINNADETIVESDNNGTGVEVEERSPHVEPVRQKRRLQQVISLGQHKEALRWMENEFSVHGQKDLYSKTIANFSHMFRGSYKANHQKVSRWWKDRHAFGENIDAQSLQRTQQWKLTRCNLKAREGQGKKTSLWVSQLYSELFEDFQRLRKTRLKFSTALLGNLARDLIMKSSDQYNAEYIDTDGKSIVSKITSRWVQTFMEKHNIVVRSQTGKLQCSPEKEEHIDRSTAYHLGELHRGFMLRELDENLIENVDETHFVINLDNNHTLGVRGDNEVKYADVVSGGESMTMMVRVTGGVSAHIETPMIIFCNQDRNNPIRGIPDNIPGACYRTGPKGWNDKRLFPHWFLERCAYQADPYGRQKILFLDNCGGHNNSNELTSALFSINTVCRFFPPCAAHKVQPADSFVISKIKDAWTKCWDEKKMDMIHKHQWSNTVHSDQSWSGKLENPRKLFFLRLAVDVVRDVNSQRDPSGLTYARKAMIRCGLVLDVTGIWHVGQLTPELQEIIAKYRNHFEGDPIPTLSESCRL